MIRFRKFLPLMAILIGAVILGTPATARASFILTLQEDAGGVTTITNPVNAGPASFTGTIGDFVIVITFGASNSPGTSNAMTQVGSISITNTSGAAHDLHITVNSQGFTSPQSPPPLTVLDTVSGSVVTGTLLGTDFQGFANAANSTVAGTGFAGQLLAIPSTGAGKSFSANGSTTGFSPNGATYSMSIIENLRLAGGTSITLTGGNVETLQTTPAPAGMLLALAGLPFLGVWSFRRRKQAIHLAQ